MDSALRDTTWEDLDNKLEGVEEIIGKKQKLEEMLRKVKEEAGMVSNRIAEKVRAEYQEKLDEVLAQLGPLESEVREARAEIQRELDPLDEQIETTQETLAEIEFRFKVGEFDEAGYQERQEPLKRSLEESAARKESLLNAYKKYDSIYVSLNSYGAEKQPSVGGERPLQPEPEAPSLADGNTPAEPLFDREELEPDPNPDRAAEEPVAHDTREQEQELTADPPVEAQTDQKQKEEFVNPTEWLDDFNSAPASESAAREETRSEPGDELFAGLELDTPTSITAEEDFSSGPKQTATENPSPTDDTPMLVIKSNNGSEKRIPVLPITLTIGREHDNNIEIKDEEAARYHARIVFKNGEYIIESLERSRRTLVNGKQVTEAALQDADTITIGKTTMFFMRE